MLVKKLEFNHPQLRFLVNILRANSGTSIWSRGTGKSFIIGWLIRTIEKSMPRSAWVIYGQSYKQILTRTLPSTISALEYIGYVEGRDYIVGKKPNSLLRWQKPFEPPSDYKHFISFRNGTGFHLVSQDGGGGASRGLNIDGIICDESLLINKEKFDQSLLPTNRGNLRAFKNVPIHHGVFHFSSMPYGSDARWLLDHGSYYYEDGHNYRDIRQQLVELQLEFIKNKDIEYRMDVWRKIEKQKKLLKYYAKNDLFYSEADVFDNLYNLGIKYIEKQYESLNILNFLVEILNWYPDKVEDGFYPSFDREHHGYKAVNNNEFINSLEQSDSALINPDSRMDADCLPTHQLRIAVDWGAKINSMTVTQYFKSINTLRFIKNLYVKHPKMLNDLATDFCKYYKHHKNKHIIFIYDHTGNSAQANSKQTYAEQFAQILKHNKWTVTFATRGAASTHADKYLLWGKILKTTDLQMPKVEFNLDNCGETVLSMSNTPMKEDGRGIHKNKSSERSSLIPQEEATHLGDTSDLQVLSLFSNLLSNSAFSADVVYT
jgi:hypothetical protein